jgi:hypothetical protein
MRRKIYSSRVEPQFRPLQVYRPTSVIRAKKIVRLTRTIFVVEGPAVLAARSRSLDYALQSVKPIAMPRSG